MKNAYKVTWNKVSDNTIGGPFAVRVVRIADGRTVSSCSGIQDEASAVRRAFDYAWSFAADRIPAPVERVYFPGQHATYGECVMALGAL